MRTVVGDAKEEGSQKLARGCCGVRHPPRRNLPSCPVEKKGKMRKVGGGKAAGLPTRDCLRSKEQGERRVVFKHFKKSFTQGGRKGRCKAAKRNGL